MPSPFFRFWFCQEIQRRDADAMEKKKKKNNNKMTITDYTWLSNAAENGPFKVAPSVLATIMQLAGVHGATSKENSRLAAKLEFPERRAR